MWKPGELTGSCWDERTACEFDYVETRLMSGIDGANNSNNAKDNANDNGEMATVMVGTLMAFDSQVQTWEEYVEVLEHFFCGEWDHRCWKEAGNIVELSGQPDI